MVLLNQMEVQDAYACSKAMVVRSLASANKRLPGRQKSQTTNTMKGYFPVSEKDEQFHAMAITALVKKTFPNTFAAMQRFCGDVTFEELVRIHVLQNLNVAFLPVGALVRMFDAFLNEGIKVLYRFFLAVVKMFKRNLKVWAHDKAQWNLRNSFLVRNLDTGESTAIASAEVHSEVSWFDYLQKQCHERSSSTGDAFVDAVCKVAFKLPLKRAQIKKFGAQSPPPSPPSATAATTEAPACPKNATMSKQSQPFPFALPLRYDIQDGPPYSELLQFGQQDLANWVPDTLAMSHRMRLVYSADVHGRRLKTLYDRCGAERPESPCLLLVEVLDMKRQATTANVIGAFATHMWKEHRDYFGGGGCFLFALHPTPRVYKRVAAEGGGHQRFMQAGTEFLSMGAGVGLRVGQTLTTGSSMPCNVFENLPLHVINAPPEESLGAVDDAQFEIGRIEVLSFRL
jgi:hypothetical protein